MSVGPGRGGLGLGLGRLGVVGELKSDTSTVNLLKSTRLCCNMPCGCMKRYACLSHDIATTALQCSHHSLRTSHGLRSSRRPILMHHLSSLTSRIKTVIVCRPATSDETHPSSVSVVCSRTIHCSIDHNTSCSPRRQTFPLKRHLPNWTKHTCAL